MALRRPALLLLLRTRVPGQPQQHYQQRPQIQRCFKSTVRTSDSPHSLRSVHHQRKEFANLEPALRAFHERHGHWAVPLRFTIPSLEPRDTTTRLQSQSQEPRDDTNWPEELQGMKLGTALSRFVKVAQKPENAVIAAKLAALGVPVDSVADWKRHIWEQVAVVALKTFHGLHGHFFVPYSFKVPANDWPRQTWGYKLGYWVVELRRDPSRLESYQLDHLRAMSFVWNAREARWNQYFVPAMKKYVELYGKQASVPQSFVVPRDDDRWPKELYGYRLGQKVNNLRCGGDKAGTSGSSLSPSSAEAEGMEWDEVELVYNNWLFLDMLHKDADSDKKTTTTADTDRAKSSEVQ